MTLGKITEFHFILVFPEKSKSTLPTYWIYTNTARKPNPSFHKLQLINFNFLFHSKKLHRVSSPSQESAGPELSEGSQAVGSFNLGKSLG